MQFDTVTDKNTDILGNVFFLKKMIFLLDK